MEEDRKEQRTSVDVIARVRASLPHELNEHHCFEIDNNSISLFTTKTHSYAQQSAKQPINKKKQSRLSLNEQLNEEENDETIFKNKTENISNKLKTMSGNNINNVIKTNFKLDKVYSPTSTQEDVFRISFLPYVVDAINGFNATIFAYGFVFFFFLILNI